MENQVLANLEPRSVFRFFEELCRIPHESGNTKAASDWVVRFAKERDLRCCQDAAGNVIIWKNASPGYEAHPAVMLQGHLDMVCVKDPGVEHDFTKDPLDLYVDGDWVKARGTTLGGDDGLAVAVIMAILDDDALPHPPVEAIFTVDEEIGLLGAAALDCSELKSRLLINLDSEAEGVLTVGCAGGARCDLKLQLPVETAEGTLCTVTLKGLQGGHSGTAINEGYANANKLLGEGLAQLAGARLVSLHGGEQDNAIPNRATAVLLVPEEQEETVREKAAAWTEQARKECAKDPNLEFSFTWDRRSSACALSAEDTRKVVGILCAAPNGVQAMEPDLPGLVRTSLNLGILRLQEGVLSLSWSVRSSKGEEKEALAGKLQELAQQNGASFARRGDYPAWEYRADSHLRDVMVRVFREQYGKEPVVETIHAGLECGLLAEKLPGLDAVSVGPDLVEIHSPRERMSISSVARIWKYLLEILAQL